jgi:hypothetical protein
VVAADSAVVVAAGFGGGGGGLKFVGGSKSTDELIASTERGILVTHFFYIRFLDQRTVLLTGLTRDGTFLIEKGKVTQALKNFRWNESPLFMLSKIDEIGKAERTAAGQVMPFTQGEGLQLHVAVGRGLEVQSCLKGWPRCSEASPFAFDVASRSPAPSALCCAASARSAAPCRLAAQHPRAREP